MTVDKSPATDGYSKREGDSPEIEGEVANGEQYGMKLRQQIASSPCK